MPRILMTWQELALQLDLIAGETEQKGTTFSTVGVTPSA